jgi:protein-S-isoprenylcysteine O-methyltransferase Ste14
MTKVPHPGVRFPPPFLFVAGILAGLALDRWVIRLRLTDVGGPSAGMAFVVLGWIGILAGLTLMLWGLGTFARARTSVMPIRPARTLVIAGPYRFTRNPMYVGLTALYLGLALLVKTLWPIVLLPGVLGALYQFVVQPEERYLASAFGVEYVEYRRRVRRWL